MQDLTQVETIAPHQMAAESLQKGAAAAAGNVRARRSGSPLLCSLPRYDWDLHKEDFVFSSYSPDTT